MTETIDISQHDNDGLLKALASHFSFKISDAGIGTDLDLPKSLNHAMLCFRPPFESIKIDIGDGAKSNSVSIKTSDALALISKDSDTFLHHLDQEIEQDKAFIEQMGGQIPRRILEYYEKYRTTDGIMDVVIDDTGIQLNPETVARHKPTPAPPEIEMLANRYYAYLTAFAKVYLPEENRSLKHRVDFANQYTDTEILNDTPGVNLRIGNAQNQESEYILKPRFSGAELVQPKEVLQLMQEHKEAFLTHLDTCFAQESAKHIYYEDFSLPSYAEDYLGQKDRYDDRPIDFEVKDGKVQFTFNERQLEPAVANAAQDAAKSGLPSPAVVVSKKKQL